MVALLEALIAKISRPCSCQMPQLDQSVVSVLALEISADSEAGSARPHGPDPSAHPAEAYGISQLLRDGSQPGRYYDIQLWRNAERPLEPRRTSSSGTCGAGYRNTCGRRLRGSGWAVELDAPRAVAEPSGIGLDRRKAPTRVQRLEYAEGERRGQLDRRLGPRRSEEQGSPGLLAAARTAWERAHAPFSGFKVGAAVETADGHIFTGSNVESASYGLTMCAERVAMFKAISEGYRAFTRIAIAAQAPRPTPPCGACRQILWELAGDIEVVLADLERVRSRHRVKDLLPLPFDAGVLDNLDNEDEG